ncbi:MAG: aminodeoxychorismate/anthranilate synthase component II [Planctomycetes bacterium]|nr:aminodeoxychorismate/anthranilate synthase component II [Planctomycetota bacterium]
MILVLDNKDSFVWNLAQALAGLGADVRVVRSDAITAQAAGDCRALVLSPGPGRPEHAGVCVEAVQRWSGQRPILGVCLGHQAIGAAFGAAIERGEPVHGRATAIHHDGQGLFAGLPDPMQACRYHALYVHGELPAPLLPTARSDDGACMALRHREHPTFGVQFHPESFRTEHGAALLGNFLKEVR